MLIKVTQKCLVSYVSEDEKNQSDDKGMVSFRHWYYDSDKENFLEAINEIVNDFDVSRASGENEDTEYDGEFLDSLGYVGFTLCEDEKINY